MGLGPSAETRMPKWPFTWAPKAYTHPFKSGVSLTIMGRDEKGCLLSTEKNAAVDVDHYSLPFSTGRRRPLPFSTGRHRPACHFLLVDIDCRHRRQPSMLINIIHSSTILLFSTWSTLSTLVDAVDTAILQPFSSCPNHGGNWQGITPPQAPTQIKTPSPQFWRSGQFIWML